MRFYQTFQPRGDPAVLTSPQHIPLQSSYSGGARRDFPKFSNIQSDQPNQQQIQIGTRGQHLRQHLVDQMLLSSDAQVRRSLNMLLGSSTQREEHTQSDGRQAQTFELSLPTVHRHSASQDGHDDDRPEEIRLSDGSANAPVSG